MKNILSTSTAIKMFFKNYVKDYTILILTVITISILMRYSTIILSNITMIEKKVQFIQLYPNANIFL